MQGNVILGCRPRAWGSPDAPRLEEPKLLQRAGLRKGDWSMEDGDDVAAAGYTPEPPYRTGLQMSRALCSERALTVPVLWVFTNWLWLASVPGRSYNLTSARKTHTLLVLVLCSF